MSTSKTLTLKKPVDPAKVAQSLEIGFRFIDRKGRYILQKLETVRYERKVEIRSFNGVDVSRVSQVALETTWVDIPLVPEVYGA